MLLQTWTCYEEQKETSESNTWIGKLLSKKQDWLEVLPSKNDQEEETVYMTYKNTNFKWNFLYDKQFLLYAIDGGNELLLHVEKRMDDSGW